MLDQFSRHILRQEPPDSELRREADRQALHVAEIITSTDGWDQNLSVGEFVFSLMPFRHSATLDRLKEVLRKIDARRSREMQGVNLLEKFRKQTVRRLQHLEDRNEVSLTL